MCSLCILKGSMSLDSRLPTASYESSSFATPVGEVCSMLTRLPNGSPMPPERSEHNLFIQPAAKPRPFRTLRARDPLNLLNPPAKGRQNPLNPGRFAAYYFPLLLLTKIWYNLIK